MPLATQVAADHADSSAGWRTTLNEISRVQAGIVTGALQRPVADKPASLVKSGLALHFNQKQAHEPI